MSLSKEERAEKLIEWMEMDTEEKRKYNGYNGFISGELFSDSNAFMTEDRARLKKRLVKEKDRINKIGIRKHEK